MAGMQAAPESIDKPPTTKVDLNTSPSNSNKSAAETMQTMRKNLAQFIQFSPGVLLLIIGGLYTEWGVCAMSYSKSSTLMEWDMVYALLLLWYVGAIIGNLIGTLLLHHVQKLTIYYISGVMYALASFMFCYWKDFEEHSEVTYVARTLSGITHGLIYITTLTHASESASKYNRGRIVSIINMTMTSTIFFGSILYVSISEFKAFHQAVAIIGLVLSIIVLLVASFVTLETVPYLLRKQNEPKALANLMRLHDDTSESLIVQNELNEMKIMVDQEKNQNIFTQGNLTPLFLIGATRIMSALASNSVTGVFTSTFLKTLLERCEVGDASKRTWPIILAPVLRFLSSWASFVVIDRMPRKPLMTYSSGITGLLIFISGLIWLGISPTMHTAYLVITTVFLYGVQLVNSFGTEPVQNILTAEGFSFNKKQWSMALVTITQYLLHIVLIVVAFGSSFGLQICSIVMGVLVMLMARELNRWLPETKGTTLMEASKAFNREQTTSLPL